MSIVTLAKNRGKNFVGELESIELKSDNGNDAVVYVSGLTSGDVTFDGVLAFESVLSETPVKVQGLVIDTDGIYKLPACPTHIRAIISAAAPTDGVDVLIK